MGSASDWGWSGAMGGPTVVSDVGGVIGVGFHAMARIDHAGIMWTGGAAWRVGSLSWVHYV